MKLSYLASFGDHIPLSQFKPDDKINVLSFNDSGGFLASGDGAGRVVVFSLNERPNGRPSVGFVCQIHAHKAEFDYFRSEVSEPKITSLKWLPGTSLNPRLVTCNSHDAKLWQLNWSSRIDWACRSGSSPADLVLPSARKVDVKYSAECIHTFADLQSEYLVDLQCLSDQRSLLMVDVAGVKLWDMERDIPAVSLCRVSQQEPEITTSAIHRALPFAFLVGDDIGKCWILDMRQQAEDLTPSIAIQTIGSLPKTVEGSASVSSLQFLDGTSFVVRTFGHLQKWDLRMTARPAAQTNVHWFDSRMEFLVHEEFVKDQFRTAVMPSGKVVTGMYSADFLSWDPLTDAKSKHRAVSARTKVPPPEPGRDFTKRVTCCEGHPSKEFVAVVSTAALFVFTADDE
jgi:serine/threonine-protein phosphatase 2A regulatory subunit B